MKTAFASMGKYYNFILEISKIQKTFDYIKNTYKPDEIKFEDIEDYSHKVIKKFNIKDCR
jgi:hypothetical protein